MTAPMFPTSSAGWLVNGTVDPALADRLDRSALVASMRSVIERPGGFAPDERRAVAQVIRAQGQFAASGLITSPAENTFAPYQFSPVLNDPAACERIAVAIERGHVNDLEIVNAVLAFPRAVAATDALTESVRIQLVRDVLGESLISDATLDEFDDIGAVPPITPDPTPSRATIVREAHAAAVKAATQDRESVAPYVGDSAMSHRTFGVELEGFLYGGEPLDLQARRARRELDAAGLLEWGVGVDSTVIDDSRQERTGLEVRSPVLRGDDGLAECIRAVQALSRAGFVTNDSCGIHVHIGVTSESLAEMKTMAATLTAQELSLDAFTTPQRRGEGSRYAMPAGVTREYIGVSERGKTLMGPTPDITPESLGDRLVAAQTFRGVLDTLNVNGDETRFHKINYRSIMKRGTVEFRGRDAYLSTPQELSDYIRLCDRLVDRAMDGECVLPVQRERFAAFAGAITLARAAAHPEPETDSVRVADSGSPMTDALARLANARVHDIAKLPIPTSLVVLDSGEDEEVQIQPQAGR